MRLKKLYLPLDSKQNFINYCNEFSDKANQKRIDKTILENYFTFCTTHETYTDLLHNTVIAGERLGHGISQIRDLQTGELFAGAEEIYNYQKAQYDANNYDFVCQELHHSMYCQIERLVRVAKSDAFEPSEKRLWNILTKGVQNG